MKDYLIEGLAARVFAVFLGKAGADVTFCPE
jgi:hypothetical protein